MDFAHRGAGELLTSPRICECLDISRWTWRRWVSRGEAPAPVAGLPGIPKWRRADIEQFADGRFKTRGGRTYFGKTRRGHDEQAVAMSGLGSR